MRLVAMIALSMLVLAPQPVLSATNDGQERFCLVPLAHDPILDQERYDWRRVQDITDIPELPHLLFRYYHGLWRIDADRVIRPYREAFPGHPVWRGVAWAREPWSGRVLARNSGGDLAVIDAGRFDVVARRIGNSVENGVFILPRQQKTIVLQEREGAFPLGVSRMGPTFVLDGDRLEPWALLERHGVESVRMVRDFPHFEMIVVVDREGRHHAFTDGGDHYEIAIDQPPGAIFGAGYLPDLEAYFGNSGDDWFLFELNEETGRIEVDYVYRGQRERYEIHLARHVDQLIRYKEPSWFSSSEGQYMRLTSQGFEPIPGGQIAKFGDDDTDLHRSFESHRWDLNIEIIRSGDDYFIYDGQTISKLSDHLFGVISRARRNDDLDLNYFLLENRAYEVRYEQRLEFTDIDLPIDEKATPSGIEFWKEANVIVVPTRNRIFLLDRDFELLQAVGHSDRRLLSIRRDAPVTRAGALVFLMRDDRTEETSFHLLVDRERHDDTGCL